MLGLENANIFGGFLLHSWHTRECPLWVIWGKKLAYLLGEGWSVDEIKRWSKERWKSGNPRGWPPEKMS